ncbi:MAG: FliH/SctL family protein [Desulfobacca sp.]|nr:FliH/SctL family protein [Desulfobacca sp.]
MSLFKSIFAPQPEKTDAEIYGFQLPQFDSPSAVPQACNFPFTDFGLDDQEANSESPDDDPQSQAERILQEARSRAQTLEQEAYEQGFAQGLQKGQEVGEQELTQVIEHFQALMAELANQQQELCAKQEQDLIHLILVIARKIIEMEISLRPQLILQVLHSTWQYLSDTESCRIRLSPQDHEWLQKHQEQLSQTLPTLDNIALIPDNRLAPGGLVLESQAGEIDATLESRWAAVARLVEEALSQVKSPDKIDD